MAALVVIVLTFSGSFACAEDKGDAISPVE